jgi:hypothetical protein
VVDAHFPEAASNIEPVTTTRLVARHRLPPFTRQELDHQDKGVRNRNINQSV